LKRAAQARQRAEVNRANRTAVRSLMKKLRGAISQEIKRARNFAKPDAERDRPGYYEGRVAREYGEPVQVAVEYGV